MEVNDLLKLFCADNQIVELENWIKKSEGNLNVTDAEGSLRAILLSAIYKNNAKRLIFIHDNAESAGYFYHDLMQLLKKNDNLLFFPSAFRSSKIDKVDAANEILRTETLTKINDPNEPFLVVTYPEALIEPIVKKSELKEKTIHLNKGDMVDLSEIEKLLIDLGFSRVDFVYEPGQFSVRGSLIDVFSFSSEYPYRIDFFGDEIDSIRTFDVENQLSKELKDSLDIVPDLHSSVEEELFFEVLPNDVLFAFSNYRLVIDCFKAIFEQKEFLSDGKNFLFFISI